MEGKITGSKFVYYLIFVQFVAQFASFFYLYVYVMKVEHEVRELAMANDGSTRVECAAARDKTLGSPPDHEPATVRRKRSGAMPSAEDNAVSEVFRARDDKDSIKEIKTASLKGDDWVWMTGDTRIPYDAVQTFCSKFSEFCPPGMPGSPGADGPPGPKGDQGLPGIQGTPGLPGPRGPPGPEGPRGEPGLDGVDGMPGEPGLDGLPGRSGKDGIPGEDGKPGLNGTPGAPGRNGNDGRHGQQGPQGPQGPPGAPGKPGLRGPPGQDGKPSIVAYTPFKINTSLGHIDTRDILIPPSIVGISQVQYVVAEEGVNLRLDCYATGKPTPVVQWTRQDGLAIHSGIWHASAIYGSSLNLSSVHRDDMGNYTCTADNGIPPATSKRYKLNVKFGPLIRVRTPTVRARNQTLLECEVEAHPKPELHWETKDGRLDIRSKKYRFQEEEYRREYKFRMKLKISNINTYDYGTYYCVARNTINITRGAITVKDTNDKSATETRGVLLYGKLPPPRPQYRSLCPAQLNCDSCPKANCEYTGVEAKPMISINFTGMPPRLAGGVIGAVGLAVFKGRMDDMYGIWMQDSSAKSNLTAGKLWVTRSTDTSHIYEYGDINDFGDKKTPRSIKLPYSFQGNGHLVNDGYFFYNPYNRSSIVRLDLTHSEGTMYAYGRLELELPGLRVNTANYLYTPNHNFNYVDFDVDENGLWAIYGTESNTTVVVKVDPDTMTIQYAWDITVDHHKYGEMFVARGVLYAVHNITDKTMNISLAVDLYQGKHLSVSLSFVNAYQKVTMLRYNSATRELYAWDQGMLLAYQVRYKETHNANGFPLAKESTSYAGANERFFNDRNT